MSSLASKLKAKRKAAVPANHAPAPELTERKILDRVVKAAKPTEISTPSKGLRGRLNKARSDTNPKKFSEIERITNLPLSFMLEPEESEEYARTLTQAESYDKGWRPFDTQTSGVMAYELFGGLFGAIGVGWGKTILTLLVASKGWDKGIKRSIIFVPAGVYPQLWNNDLPAARSRVVISPQFHGLGGKNMQQRMALAKSGRKGVYVLPYSLLSTRDSNELLEAIKPGLIIADEAHLLKNRRAARTKRVMNYVADHKPEFVAVSGTITDKSILDYWHLIKAALGDNIPLPITQIMASEWSQVLDAKASPSAKQTGPIRPLVDWAREKFPEEQLPFDVTGFRRAYRMRLATAPGVVATSDHEIGTSLVFENKRVEYDQEDAGYVRMKDLIQQIEDEWLTPNGDEIEHAIHTHKWMFELCTGFYNELIWPEAEKFAKRKSIDLKKAIDILDRAREHHGLANEYSRQLRKWLDAFARPGMDTPLLVGREISMNAGKHVGPELAQAWKDMHDADFEGRPDRDSRTVRVCDYKIKDAVKTAESWTGGGILWYWHQGIGQWLAEACEEAGLDFLHCPAGAEHNKRVIDVENKNKIIIASISAHGEGKNLQHFKNQLFVQWYRNCKKAEQVLGRLHRNGQEADELIVQTNRTLMWDHENFGATLVDALYVHQSTGNRQKLIYGGYNPMPVVFPPEVLRERGFEGVQMLSKEQRELMEEKFGKTT